MTKKKVDWRIVCTGLLCLTVAELYALSQGINGWLMRIYVIVIATAIGITLPQLKTK